MLCQVQYPIHLIHHLDQEPEVFRGVNHHHHLYQTNPPLSQPTIHMPLISRIMCTITITIIIAGTMPITTASTSSFPMVPHRATPSIIRQNIKSRALRIMKTTTMTRIRSLRRRIRLIIITLLLATTTTTAARDRTLPDHRLPRFLLRGLRWRRWKIDCSLWGMWRLCSLRSSCHLTRTRRHIWRGMGITTMILVLRMRMGVTAMGKHMRTTGAARRTGTKRSSYVLALGGEAGWRERGLTILRHRRWTKVIRMMMIWARLRWMGSDRWVRGIRGWRRPTSRRVCCIRVGGKWFSCGMMRESGMCLGGGRLGWKRIVDCEY